MGERFSEFDASKVAEVLGTKPRAVHDVAHGDGDALTVGDAVLEVYPAAGIARVTTTDARIELFRVPEYATSDGRVVFEQGPVETRTRLRVRADGNVAFHPVLRAPQTPQTVETGPGGHQDSSAPTTASEGTTRRRGATNVPLSKEGEVRPAQLTGRLGRDPWYNSQGEQPMAGFPLAVNDDKGATTWHRVVTFGETADMVKAALQTGQIRKGRLVELSGTEVPRQEPTGRGGTRTVVEFHATSVTRLKNTTVPHPQGR